MCARCHEVIHPGDEWDLGHRPDGSPSKPEHARCNRGAANENRKDR